MIKEIEIRFPAQIEVNENNLLLHSAKQLKIQPDEIGKVTLLRRSVDARKKIPEWVLKVKIWMGEEYENPPPFSLDLKDVSHAPYAVICGFGPAGMFAALKLIESGVKPIILERGKDVRRRRRDLALLNRDGDLNPESNYCFGEGGAGTFSDGKLYTRSEKRGNVSRILEIFHLMGATEDILIDAHPHIGTNKLPAIISKIRETIESFGGEVRFDSKLTGIKQKDGQIHSVEINANEWLETPALLLATGHSARDIFFLLRDAGIRLEQKPFSLGVRVEHPQALIDKIRLHCEKRPDYLPAASYSLVSQINDKGVFSFCMCPGGIICPSSTAAGELVVNGWSPSKRDSAFANSGIVTEISGTDLNGFENENEFSGLAFQRDVEQKAFLAGGGKMVAPGLRLSDFVSGKISSTLPDCSYLPGISPADFKSIFPKSVLERLRKGFIEFGKKMPGYITEEAVIVATESRTSSPIRIPRDRESFMHPESNGLFPCGEGAGYAGGIVSAAMDGENCALAIAKWMQVKA